MNMKRINSVLSLAAILLMSFLNSCLDVDQGISQQAQLEKDIAAIDNYLAVNFIPAVKHTSGVRFVIQEMGTGLTATMSSNVKVKYVGRLLSTGTIFDQKDDGILGTPSGFIDGWKIALTRLPQGTKATIYVPSVWAYGSGGSATIPKNSNLVFDIEILSVAYNAQQQTQLNNDITAIDTYLAENEIEAIEDPSGIRYQILQEGNGDTPELFSKVKIKLKGTLLSSNTVFLQETTVSPSDSFDSYVTDYTYGLKLGLLLFPVGTKAKVFVPSTIAYGSAGATGVPANANVVFEVEVLEIDL
jgi:FKBP-type peptidyl-prolyl cis-trans isomerase